MNNGYSSATGQQYIPSTGKNFAEVPTGQADKPIGDVVITSIELRTSKKPQPAYRTRCQPNAN